MNRISLNVLYRAYLPENAKILDLNEPFCFDEDFDLDGYKEVIMAYELKQEHYIIVFKEQNRNLKMVTCIKLPSFITFYQLSHFTGDKRPILYIGVTSIDNKNKLMIFGSETGKFKNLIKDDYYFDRLELKETGEIALWLKEEDGTFNVNLYRYRLGKLYYALDLYSKYFVDVVKYYQNQDALANENPAIYLYQLAMGQMKAKLYFDVIDTLNKALKLPNPYPSHSFITEVLNRIKKKINVEERLFEVKLKTNDCESWGYINKLGIVKIEPRFNQAFPFNEYGFAIVVENNLYGTINKTGDYIITPQYLKLSPFYEGRSIALTNEGYHVINYYGDQLTKKAYPLISNYQTERAIYRENNQLYGYLDLRGEAIIPAKFLHVSPFREKEAIVKLVNQQYAMINHEGVLLKTFSYYYVGEIHEGLMGFKTHESSLYGYLNKDGEVMIEPRFDYASNFRHQRSLIKLKQLYGLIDVNGDFLFEPKYEEIKYLDQEFVGLKSPITKSFAIGNHKGMIITPFIFDDIKPYMSGTAIAYYEDRSFLVNRKGEVIRSFPIDLPKGIRLEQGLIKAEINQQLVYFDLNGTRLFPDIKFN